MSHDSRVSAPQYWLLIDYTPHGPLAFAEVRAKLDAGYITLSTLASCDCQIWLPLKYLLGLASTPAHAPTAWTPPTPVHAAHLSAKTVLVLSPQAERSPITTPAATPTPLRSHKRGWVMLCGAGVVLLWVFLVILLWPGDNSGTEKGQNSGKRTLKDYPLAHTKWLGKEHIHKTPDELTFEFLDDKDVRKTSRERKNSLRTNGDYVVRENEVTITLRYKKLDPTTGHLLYERIVYAGVIKDRTIVGEARVEQGAWWHFEVAQVDPSPAPSTKH
jgi:hypothetical protein